MAEPKSKNYFQNFWDNVAENYDRFVLSDSSPTDIKQLEMAEDAFFHKSLERHIYNQKKTVFIEVGSGTGRYLLKSLEKIIENNVYKQYLTKLIGIDFSLNMIEKSINKINDMIPKFAEFLKIDVTTVERQIKEKVMLINADVARPYISIEGDVSILVGIMFGTLGNIPQSDHDAVLSRVKSLIAQDGEGIITVFNAEQQQIGKDTYKQLESLVGTGLKWDATTKTFSTYDGGFYSHWFGKDQFVNLLTRWFSIRDMKEIGKQGIVTRINANNRKNGSIFISNRPQKIFLLCPICSSKLIPNTDKRLIVCQCCSNRFPINDIQGFKVPILLNESKCSD